MTNEIPIEPEAIAKYVTTTEELEAQALSLTIVDNDAYLSAVEIGKTARTVIRGIKDEFAETKALANKLHKQICERERFHLERPERVFSIVKRGLKAYDDEQERIAAVARKAAEDAARAERERLEAEVLRLAEEAALNAALAAEESGESEKAAEILAHPEVFAEPAETPPPPPAVISGAPAVQGLGKAKLKKANVTDLLALVKHVAEHPEHLNLIEANQPAINKLAQALGDSLDIPGIEFVEDRSYRFGR